MKTERLGTTSKIAMCYDCDWRCEVNKKSAYGNAKHHAKSKKHKVAVETAIVINYDGRRK